MKLFLLILTLPLAHAQLVPGTMDVHWDEGKASCAGNSAPPIQVHPYNARTFILRENLCLTFEAPFMYLLLGSTRALLIDTGDIADPNQAPLSKTVLDLAKLPLLVVHTHRHLDHRAGDGQFANLPGVEVVGYDLDSVRNYYKFTDWPNGVAEIELGERTVDVIPTPGHNATEVSFYDRNTGLFFTGDFLMPARLLVEDTAAYLASAQRAAEFVKNRPVSFVLGGHIEMDRQGALFPWQSQYHPQEHVLEMRKEDLLALPAALSGFNGFYSTSGQFVMMHQMRLLILFSSAAILVVAALIWLLVRYLRRRKLNRAPA
jgi:glyoxylase-like metal-dependent hydrolase (beta-lactamase superfamily II)